MKKIPTYLAVSCFCGLFCFGGAQAVPTAREWQAWVAGQVLQHPDVVAAREGMNATLSLADAQDQPLYNPELNTEYEREGEDNNYLLGINQTVDLWDKRGVQSRQAVFSRQIARQTFELSLQQVTADVLRALVQWQAAQETADLMEKLEDRLKCLLTLVKKRQLAGDLGQLDVELTFLDLAQRLNETAQAQASLRRLEFQLRNLLPGWTPAIATIPDDFWENVEGQPMLKNDEIMYLPAVLMAKAWWQASEEAVNLSRRNAKSDPTLGLNAGATGGENVVSLTLSFPLFFRNTYSAETRAAGQELSAARAAYESQLRFQGFAVQAAHEVLQQYSLRYGASQRLLAGRRQSSGELLEKQWQSGDLNTMDYIQVMDRRSASLLSGIELSSRYRQAGIDWLLNSGALRSFFGSQPSTQDRDHE